LQDVSLDLWALDPEADKGLGDHIKGGGSDDRGYFRLWGVRPGTYYLEARPVRVTVQSGEEVSGLQIVMRLSEVFRVSGRVVSLPDDGKRREIQAREVRTPEDHGFGIRGHLDAEGNFYIEGLPLGDYGITLWSPEEGSSPQYADASLGTLEVARDLEDVILQPQPPTGIRGRFVLEGLDEGASVHVPEVYGFSLYRTDGRRPVSIAARGPEWEFERTDLLPGEYELRLGFRMPYLKNPNEAADGSVTRIHVSEGNIETLNLILSARGSRITGRVWAAKAGDQEQIPGSYYRVGLQSRLGKSRHDRRSVIADQEGRFDFGRFRPGEYEICAWSDLGQREVEGTQVWEEAAEAVRRFTLQEEMDVEIDLTAVP
jgi:hypothetical protein